MNRKTLQSLILALEAALIIVSLVTGSGTTVGMICYWSIAALNHLTDFIIRWIEERLVDCSTESSDRLHHPLDRGTGRAQGEVPWQKSK